MVLKVKTWGKLYAPKRISKGDWIDLRAHGDYKLHLEELALIRLGVAMELPDGYEAIIAPRSSTPKNFGIIQANSIGVIDNSYCGDDDEWGMFVMALRDTVIHDGDRIAQFRIQKNQPDFDFEFVNSLGNPNRGGWGSTGTR